MPPPESHWGIPLVDPTTLTGLREKAMGPTGTTPGTLSCKASEPAGTGMNAALHKGGDASTSFQGNSVLCNLLPSLYSTKDSSGTVGIYVGEGLPPVQVKQADKIRRWEFVEMNELLPKYQWARP